MSIAIPQAEHGTFRLDAAGDPKIIETADIIRKNHGDIAQDVDELDLHFITGVFPGRFGAERAARDLQALGFTVEISNLNPPPPAAVPRQFRDNYDEWVARDAAITARIRSRLGRKRMLIDYDAYQDNADGLPIDNLDEIAVQGKVCFHRENRPFFGRGTDYTSPIVDSPTWLDVAVIANESVKVTGDRAHWFFDGIAVVDERDGIKHARILSSS